MMKFLSNDLFWLVDHYVIISVIREGSHCSLALSELATE